MYTGISSQLKQAIQCLSHGKYDKWLAEEGINHETPSGNLKPPLRPTIVKWTLEAWCELTPDLIKKSFKACALNLFDRWVGR